MMEQLYFGMWKLMLMLPVPLRVLVELLIILAFIALLWPVLKYFFVLVTKLLLVLNKGILGGIRTLLCRFAKNSVQIHEWDEKVGEQGRKIDNLLRAKERAYKGSKRRDILKKKGLIISVGIIYIAAILPEFKLERLITESYLENIYFVSRVFSGAESKLTEGIENYPDLFKKQEKEREETEDIVEETVQETLYLALAEETSYANIREKADLDSESICTISKTDQIIYQNIYEHDGERYWLKVAVLSQNNMEGWISAKVIDAEVLNTLDLP